MYIERIVFRNIATKKDLEKKIQKDLIHNGQHLSEKNSEYYELNKKAQERFKDDLLDKMNKLSNGELTINDLDTDTLIRMEQLDKNNLKGISNSINISKFTKDKIEYIQYLIKE